MSQTKSQGELPRNSDDYLATLLALGPGLVACALMGVVEFAGQGVVSLLWIFTYPAALLAFLPGLPALGLCLARAWPRETGMGSERLRSGWLLLSSVVPMWHIAIVDVSGRLMSGQSPIEWGFVARYDACLWLITVVFWAFWRRQRA
jgi:hypothetical protein